MCTIGNFAFSKCSGLTNVTIPNTVTCIQYGTFENCSNLTNISMPNNIWTIEAYAFHGCESLISIVLPSELYQIGNYAFSQCKLSKIALSDRICNIGDDAFSKSTVICVFENSYAAKWAYNNYYELEYLYSVVVNNDGSNLICLYCSSQEPKSQANLYKSMLLGKIISEKNTYIYLSKQFNYYKNTY